MAVIRRTALIEVPVEIARSRCGRLDHVHLAVEGREDGALKLPQRDELAWGGEAGGTEPRLSLSVAPLAGQSTWMVWLLEMPDTGSAPELRDAAQALGQFVRNVADDLERSSGPDCDKHRQDRISQ